MIFLIILSSILKYNIIIINYDSIIYNSYLTILHYFNITEYPKIINKLKLGTFSFSLENGGRARITSFLFNYISQIKIFDLHLFSNKEKGNNEYLINENINRHLIKHYSINNLIKAIKKKKINIFFNQISNNNEINIFNTLKNIKVIYILHQSLFFWIYANYTHFKNVYKTLKKSRFIISFIHLENDYIFKKWGLKTIFMNNFITYDYNYSFPSNLISKIILMIGRADAKYKRFELGIQSLEYIIKEIPECQMKIISKRNNVFFLENLINNLILKNNIKFYGYTSNPEIYFKNASLHILTSISESFSLVLSETKIYGIPNIILGLDYISIKKGGVIIIYEDTVEIIAKEALKIIINSHYRKNLGYEARINMIQFRNGIIFKNWIKLILSVFLFNDYYKLFRESYKKISEKEALEILQKQIQLLKNRNIYLKNNSLNDIEKIILNNN